MQVVEQAAALTDLQQQTAAAVMVFLVNLQMLGEHVDRGGQDCDLHFGRSGIVRSAAVLGGNLRLLFFGKRQRMVLLEQDGLARVQARIFQGPSRRPGYHSRAPGGEARLLAQIAARMKPFLVPVIYGSVRTARQGIKAARFVERELVRRGIEAILIDPLEKPLPLLDRMYKEFPPGTAPAVMEELAVLFRQADGFAIVSGEYNNGIPPALKNLLDHFLEEYFWRPAAIACYSGGRWGGVRGAMQLRMTLAEMGMVTIPSLLPTAHVGDAFTDDGTPTDPKTERSSAEFFDEFIWYMDALRERRKNGVPY